MSCTKDVDDAILEQARALQPYVRANGHPHTTVESLTDVPWFLVLVFELLTTETIPLEMKPFSCLEEQAYTLQMILDTLEQTLRLPMNHITGKGLARLERRHLSDALEILSDLVKHYFPTSTPETGNRGVSDTPEGRTLALSHFESPEFGAISFIKSCTPEISTLSTGRGMRSQEKQLESNVNVQKQFERSARNSPVVTVRPVPQICSSPVSTTVKKGPISRYAKVEDRLLKKNNASIPPVVQDESFQSSKSSMTLVKEFYRKSATGNDVNRGRIDPARKEKRHIGNDESPTHTVFDRRLPSLSLLSPIKSEPKIKRVPYVNQTDGRNMSPLETRSHRYRPYEQPSKPYDLIEYPLTKRVADFPSQRRLSSTRPTKLNQNSLKRPPSVNRHLCRKPSVKSFRSPKPSVPKRTVTHPKENACINSKPNMKTDPKNKFPPVIERNISSRTTSDIKSSARTTKESQAFLNRCRNPSVIKSKPNPPATGTVRKPPQPFSGKPPSKSITCSYGQRPCSRTGTSKQRTSVSSRRQGDIHVMKNPLPSENKSHRTSSSPFVQTKSSEPYENANYNRRRPSVVSTKVRKHSSSSARSPVHAFERNSRFRRPLKRGEVSPQTTSLCSSLKLLEEFDYIKRRLKEIKLQKREYMEAISELEREEVRLEYLLTHVQQQSTRALYKGSSERVASLGVAV